MGEETDYSFRYLRERNKFFRLDIILMYITIPLYIHTFGVRVFDAEDLVANFSLIGLGSLHGFMFFLPFWSNLAGSILHYSSVKSIDNATHVFATAYHKKQHTTSSGIVPICYVEESDLHSGETHCYIEYRK